MRMRNAARSGKADRARPEGHGGSSYHIRFIFAYPDQRLVGGPSSFLVHNVVLRWLRGRLTAVGKSETELAIDVQLASRAASRRFEGADERPKVRVEAVGVRRSRLRGDGFGVPEGTRPRQLTVQISPRFGFGACDRRIRACVGFSHRHRRMISNDGAVRLMRLGPAERGVSATSRQTPGITRFMHVNRRPRPHSSPLVGRIAFSIQELSGIDPFPWAATS
jgi:hypothetical protein